MNSRMEALLAQGLIQICLCCGPQDEVSISLYEELMIHHLGCRLYTLNGDYFMNKEGCLTFGGRSLVDEVNHVPRVFLCFSLMMFCFHLLALCLNVFVSFLLLCSYNHAGQLIVVPCWKNERRMLLLLYCSIVWILCHFPVIMMLQCLRM